MSADIHADRILILDFGSQYTQLIARRVRELGVYSEIHPWDMDAAALRAFAPKGIILSGGPESVTEAGSPRAADVVWSLGVPVLGICYGMQTMAVQLGGAVQPGEVKEFGYAEIRAHGHSRLLRRHRGPRQRRGPRPARCVDEPRRPRQRAARGLQAHRLHRRRAARRHGG
jgi:GMP synthase (glutamine-hydrolysing)